MNYLCAREGDLVFPFGRAFWLRSSIRRRLVSFLSPTILDFRSRLDGMISLIDRCAEVKRVRALGQLKQKNTRASLPDTGSLQLVFYCTHPGVSNSTSGGQEIVRNRKFH